MMLLFASLAVLRVPQDLELAGKVRDSKGAAVVGASVELGTLPLLPAALSGTRSSYKLAMASQRQSVPMPKTVTDGDGEWRMLLSPQQSALAAAEAVEMELVVRAQGFATWRRAIGASWLAASGQTATLQTPGAGLALQLEGHGGAYLGYALVERPFRVPGGRTVWLQDLLRVPGSGKLEYPEPPRVPGEVAAQSPTARLEAYKVTLFCADLEGTVTFVGAGATRLAVRPAEGGRRKILKERAELVPGPIEATWSLAGHKIQLGFESARVPLLGSEAPIAVTTKLGPVALDAWDPDQPLFLRDLANADELEHKAEPPTEGTFSDVLVEVKRKDQPVFGAGVWIEDPASKRSGKDAVLAAMTDPRGRATLRGIPAGTWRIFTRHAVHGQREALVTAPSKESVALTLAKRDETDTGPKPTTLAGTLLLDCGERSNEAAKESLEVGVLGPDGKLVRKVFEAATRYVRLDGLVPGPTNLYVRTGTQAPTVLGGILAQDSATSDPGELAVAIASAVPHVIRIHVRDSQGAPVPTAKLSLGEATPAGKDPSSLGLLPLEPTPEAGTFLFKIRALGNLWARVHGPAGEHVDVVFPGQGDVLDVRLKAPAPEPEGAASRRRR